MLFQELCYSKNYNCYSWTAVILGFPPLWLILNMNTILQIKWSHNSKSHEYLLYDSSKAVRVSPTAPFVSKPPSGLGVALVVKHNQTIHNPTSKLVCQSFLLWHFDYLSAAAILFSTVSFRSNEISCAQLRLIFLSLTLRIPDPHPTGGTASPWFQLKDTYQLKDTTFINSKSPRL